MMTAAASGTFDVDHYSKFKADLDHYLHDKEVEVEQSRGYRTQHDRYLNESDDPFFLSC